MSVAFEWLAKHYDQLQMINYLDDDEFLDNLTVDELKKLLIRHLIEHKN